MKKHVAAAIALAIAVLAAGEARAQQQQGEMTEPVDTSLGLAAVVDTYLEVWNSRDYDVLDGILAPNHERIAPDESTSGIEQMKAFIKQVHATYPDFELVVDEKAFGDGIAFIHWTVTGTHTGEGGPIPATGKSVDVSGITLLRIENGLVSAEIVKYDTAEIQEQLGIAEIPHAE